jgi:hypothetical protein
MGWDGRGWQGWQVVAEEAGRDGMAGMAGRCRWRAEVVLRTAQRLPSPALQPVPGWAALQAGAMAPAPTAARAPPLAGVPWLPMGRWRLPADVVEEVATDIRRLARLLWTLHLNFEQV